MTIPAAANDQPSLAPLDPASVQVAQGPRNGDVQGAGGSFIYTPRGSFSGDDSFTYTVADNRGVRSKAATVAVVVENSPAPTGCLFERANRHLHFHHPALYSSMVEMVLGLPPIEGRVSVLRDGQPVAGASVTLRSSKPVFPGPSGLPEMSESSGQSGEDGVASIAINPPKPNPTDTIQLTANVMVDDVEYSCKGALVVGLGVQLLPYLDALDALAAGSAQAGQEENVALAASQDLEPDGEADTGTRRRLPLLFEENRGQAEPSAGFVTRVGGKRMLIGSAGVWLPAEDAPVQGLPTMELAHRNTEASGEVVDWLPGRSNYLLGAHSEEWITGVRQASKVRYRSIYSGIDVVYYGNNRRLEYDFVVAPGADPGQIQLRFPRSSRPRVSENGDLVVGEADSSFRLKRPLVYQLMEGKRWEIAGDFRVDEAGAVGFELGDWDPALELVIDPILEFSSYFGGTSDDAVNDVVTDAEGNIYVTGATASQGLATAGASQGTKQLGGLLGTDAFVAKFDPTGMNLLYLTYIGGSNEDTGFGIALDGEGNSLVVGTTASSDFPTVDAMQTQNANAGALLGLDSFVLKLDAAGSALEYSTYLGGKGLELEGAIDVDAKGNAYVVASTTSTDLPVVNALQPQSGGTASFSPDAMVAKFDPTGNPVFVTYLGASMEDWGFGIAADGAGNAWVTGMTRSPDFPIAGFAVQNSKRGTFDAFLAKIHSGGRHLLYSSYLGGTHDDAGRDVAVDRSANVYVAGSTGSDDFPVSEDSRAQFKERGVRGQDAFVAKLTTSGREIEYSTFLGGGGTELVHSISVGADGRVVVGGDTDSSDLELVRAFQSSNRGLYDAFVMKLDPVGGAEYTTYVGGTGHDGASGVALSADGHAVVGGMAISPDFPTTEGARQSNPRGSSESFLSKLIPSGPTPILTTEGLVSAADFSGTPLAPDMWVALFGENLAEKLVLADGELPTRLGGTSVAIVDRAGRWKPAKLQFVSPNRLNFLMPSRLISGNVTVEVTNDGGQVGSAPVRVERVAPSLFTANASGMGPAAATFLRVAADGARTEDFTFDPNAAAGARANVPIHLGDGTDQVFISFFGTGFRNQRSFTATVGGVEVPAVGAVAQGQFEGLDQAVIGPIPAGLAGSGEVDVVLTFDDKDANTVTVNLQ